ncbi:MAG TPA: NAD(P)/FAD-dependent oxidoreductase [Burkholderiales bacterium]|nr:NAD(P)/FAD-dependent oxidoreductase [Burkholderiales bacterium]
MTQVDVLVIGGGPGGTPAAMALAGAGRRVLLVEKGAGLGGTCLFEGCIPSKILHESARRLEAIKHAGEFGLRLAPGEIRVDWKAVMARKTAILGRRAEGALQRARQIPTLDVQFGSATLLGARAARITPRDGSPAEVEFASAIIATGSVPNLLPIAGIELPQVLTSERLLEIADVPERLVVIGAGPIGVEMAQIFAAFGSQVTLLEAGPRILAPVDEEIALALQSHLRRQGIALELGVRILQIAGSDAGVRVQFRDATGAQRAVDAQCVLEAAGRSPNVDGLGLEHTAVRYDQHGVKVDGKLETDEPGIYAVGDVIGHPMFAHWATAQGLALAGHLLGRPARFPTPASNTAVIFSTPEVGIAGLTESEARAAGHEVRIARYDYRGDARAQVSGQAEGMLKLVYDQASRAVLGVHILAEGAASLLGEGALAVSSAISVQALAAAIHPHPTLSESIGTTAREVLASGR